MSKGAFQSGAFRAPKGTGTRLVQILLGLLLVGAVSAGVKAFVGVFKSKPLDAGSYSREPGPFHGSGRKTVGTITVPSNGTTVLHWRCSGCGDDYGGFFDVINHLGDAQSLDFTTSDSGSGSERVASGVYTNVQVGANDGWTITFSRRTPR